MGISRVFDVSSRALLTYQKAISVTSHNLTNANNDKYSRQVVDFSADDVDKFGGLGVKIADIHRVRNQLVDKQLRSYYSNFSDADKRTNILSQLEAVINEPSDTGLSSYINSFFDSWSELSVTPNSSSLRINVLQSAQKLSNKIKSLYDGVDEIRSTLINEVKDKVDDVNRHLKDITQLNQKIFEAKISNADVNDLMDLRDKAIDELSGLVNINVNYDDQGGANVSVAGLMTADRFSYQEIQYKVVDNNLIITASDGITKLALKGGDLFATTDFYNNKITGYLKTLDDVSNSILSNVNQMHSQGYSLHNPPLTGINFFETYHKGELQINSQIIKDVNYIAVSKDGTSGNGDLAKNISALKNQNLMNGRTISQNYSDMISSIGADKIIAEQSREANQSVVTQLEQQKASSSGVSVDEEMAMMIRYQRSYDAAAKMIKVADEMLQTLINVV